MIATRLIVDPSIQEAFNRGNPAELRKMLRKSVSKRARPVLAKAMEYVPRRSGLLQSSLGITMREDAGRGEIMAGVGVKDNITFMQDGRKKLVTSTRNAKRAAKLAARRGLANATMRTAFQYVWGIETGTRRNGRIARKAGGAHMLERGMTAETQPFIDGISDDVMQQITKQTT